MSSVKTLLATTALVLAAALPAAAQTASADRPAMPSVDGADDETLENMARLQTQLKMLELELKKEQLNQQIRELREQAEAEEEEDVEDAEPADDAESEGGGEDATAQDGGTNAPGPGGEYPTNAPDDYGQTPWTEQPQYQPLPAAMPEPTLPEVKSIVGAGGSYKARLRLPSGVISVAEEGDTLGDDVEIVRIERRKVFVAVPGLEEEKELPRLGEGASASAPAGQGSQGGWPGQGGGYAPGGPDSGYVGAPSRGGSTPGGSIPVPSGNSVYDAPRFNGGDAGGFGPPPGFDPQGANRYGPDF